MDGAPDSYQGFVFNDRFDGGKAGGSLRLTTQSVIFTTRDGVTCPEFPLTDLDITLGGASDRLVFFKSAKYPDWSFYTSDQTVLRDEILLRNPQIAIQLAAIGRKKAGVRVGYLVFAAVMIALIWGIFAARDPVVRKVTEQVPPEWEEKLGSLAFSQIRLDRVILEDPKLDRQLKQLTEPLLAGIEDKRHPFRFFVVRDPGVNAFALPGGYVVLHTGLIEQAESPEEVLGVLGHEVAHVTQRHGMRNIIGTAGIFMLAQAFFGDATGVLALLTDAAPYLLNQKFSREYEREADMVGLRYLVAADIDPEGLVVFLEKLKGKHVPEEAEEALSLMSSHPATSERIDYLHDAIRDYKQSGQLFQAETLPLEELKATITEVIGSKTEGEGSGEPEETDHTTL